VTVRELTGAERDRIYAEQARRYPGFAEYARQTAGVRTIPVLELGGRSPHPKHPPVRGHTLLACGPLTRHRIGWAAGQELAVLRAGVEALGRGEGAVVWVEGEPGIGKSSLVAEALAAGGARGGISGGGSPASSPSGCRCA
jgi:Predicted ATPase